MPTSPAHGHNLTLIAVITHLIFGADVTESDHTQKVLKNFLKKTCVEYANILNGITRISWEFVKE